MKKAAEILKESDMLLFDVARAAKASSVKCLKKRTESCRVATVKNKCLPVLCNDRIIKSERTCFEYEKSY